MPGIAGDGSFVGRGWTLVLRIAAHHERTVVQHTTLSREGVGRRIIGEVSGVLGGGAMGGAVDGSEIRPVEEDFARIEVEAGDLGGLVMVADGEGMAQGDAGDEVTVGVQHLPLVLTELVHLAHKLAMLLVDNERERAGDSGVGHGRWAGGGRRRRGHGRPAGCRRGCARCWRGRWLRPGVLAGDAGVGEVKSAGGNLHFEVVIGTDQVEGRCTGRADEKGRAERLLDRLHGGRLGAGRKLERGVERCLFLLAHGRGSSGLIPLEGLALRDGLMTQLLELLVGQVRRKRFRLGGGEDHGSSSKGRVAQQLTHQQDQQAGGRRPGKDAVSEPASA